jgi:hypothetical protein
LTPSVNFPTIVTLRIFREKKEDLSVKDGDITPFDGIF